MSKTVYKKKNIDTVKSAKPSGDTPAKRIIHRESSAEKLASVRAESSRVDTSWYHPSNVHRPTSSSIDTSWYHPARAVSPTPQHEVSKVVRKAPEAPSRTHRRKRRKRWANLPTVFFLLIIAFIIFLVARLIFIHDDLVKQQDDTSPSVSSGIGAFIQRISSPDFINPHSVPDFGILSEQSPQEPLTSLSEVILDAEDSSLSQWPELESAIAKGNDVAFLAVDIITGHTMAYQSDKSFYLASAIKAPYALYAFRRMDAGELYFDTPLVYTENFYDDGTGDIKFTVPGTSYTLGYLIQESLHCSDNIAYRMAVYAAGKDGFNAMMDEYGIEGCHFTETNIWPSATPREMALLWSAILDYTESDAPHAKNLKDDLLGTRYSPLRSTLNFKRTVADKHGWQDSSFNECAIVYDNEGSPLYLVAVLTLNGILPNDSTYSTTYPILGALIRAMDVAHEEAAGNN